MPQIYLTIRQFIGVVAGVLLVAGVIGLTMGVTAGAGYGLENCGNALAGSANASQSCESDLLGRRLWAWPLAGLGAVGLAGALFVVTPGRRERDVELDDSEATDA